MGITQSEILKAAVLSGLPSRSASKREELDRRLGRNSWAKAQPVQLIQRTGWFDKGRE